MSANEAAARIAELEALLVVAIDENRRLQGDIARASAVLASLDRYMSPKTAREAILGVLSMVAPDSSLAYCDNNDPTWKHITPTYKVAEVVEYATRYLRGES